MNRFVLRVISEPEKLKNFSVQIMRITAPISIGLASNGLESLQILQKYFQIFDYRFLVLEIF